MKIDLFGEHMDAPQLFDTMIGVMKDIIVREGDITPTVIGVKTQTHEFIPYKMSGQYNGESVMPAITSMILTLKSKGVDEVLIFQTAWMKKVEGTTPPSDYRHGDIFLSPDKMEVFIAIRINLKTKEKIARHWEIKRLGKQVEISDLLPTPTGIEIRILDDIL